MSVNIVNIYANWAKIFEEEKEHLIKLDSVAGDGDLGLVMFDGFTALYEDIKNNPINDLGKQFFASGKLFNNVAPSSMGTLISVGFTTVGKELKGKTSLEKEELVSILEGLANGVQRIGKAKEGEKTFLDAMFPAARAARGNIDKDEKEMMCLALMAAEKGVEDAKQMVAKHGRIAFRQENSIGVTDPGSVAAMYIVKGIKEAI